MLTGAIPVPLTLYYIYYLPMERMSYPTYSDLELEIQQLEQENKKLKERIRFLEQCLDNKEKVNKSLREELEIWKLTAKDYAKQCWVDLDE